MRKNERLPWFPCFPSKLLGAFAGMHPDEGYIYWIVCLRIYEVGGPCPDSAEVLSRRSGIPRGRVQKALDRSFEDGRLVKVEGGIINPFADEILSDRKAFQKSRENAGRAGGIKSAEIRKQKQQISPSKRQAKVKQDPTHLHIHRQLQLSSNEDNTARAKSARLGDGWPDDYLEVFWKAFPPYRREGKKAVATKLAGIRRKAEVSWQTLIEGAYRYAASEPGEYACAPMVWLNQGRWDMAPRAPKRQQNGNGFAQLLRERQGAAQHEGFGYDDSFGGTIIDASPIPNSGGSRH